MKVLKSDYADWRLFPITVAMLHDLADAAGGMVETIINSTTSDPARDQYLKGYIAGLSAASGWTPELVDDPEQLDEEEDDDEAI